MTTNGCSISFCWPLLVAVAILLQQIPPCTCLNLKSSPFVPRRSSTPWKEDSMFAKKIAPTTSTTLLAKRTKEEKQNEKNPLTLVSWYAVEAFGKIFAPPVTSKDSSDDETNDQAIDLTLPPRSLSETLARIELDFERSYFLSGAVDKLIYDPDCTFSDPFVSFNGRDRFVENLSNLGSFITKYSAKRLQYAVVSEPSPVVKTKVMVKLELNLPWKPVLAWPWGVEYEIDPSTNLIVEHRELWDIEPWEGVKQIFRRATVQV